MTSTAYCCWFQVNDSDAVLPRSASSSDECCSRTARLRKRLLRKRVSSGSALEEKEIKQLARVFLRDLDLPQLQLLHSSVRGGLSTSGQCGCLPSTNQDHFSLLLRLYRGWRGCTSDDVICSEPSCASFQTTSVFCLNPFHWSRLQSEQELLGSSTTYVQLDITSDTTAGGSSGLGSMPTDSEGVSVTRGISTLDSLLRPAVHDVISVDQPLMTSSDEQWCSLAYWEHRRRMGPRVDVVLSHLLVQWALQTNTDELTDRVTLSVKTLLRRSSVTDSVTNSVRRTRQKISHGVSLTRLNSRQQLMIVNRSRAPLFVGCSGGSAFPAPDTRASNQRLAVDHALLLPYSALSSAGSTLLLSFGKGWASGSHGRYKRREILQCPCWLEIIIT